MERETNKHAPRVDDEMKKETDSFTHGAPVESRAQESREKEPPADGEPTPDQVISTIDEDLPPTALSEAEIEERRDLARYIEGAAFPGSREEIIESAADMGATEAVLAKLRTLPEGSTYEGFPDVWLALGGRIEGERGATGRP